MPTPVRMIPVYALHQPDGTLPQCQIDYDAARDYVLCGLARWINRCKAIRLRHADVHVKLRDVSCQMGPEVIERAAMGSRYDRMLAEAWA